MNAHKNPRINPARFELLDLSKNSAPMLPPIITKIKYNPIFIDLDLDLCIDTDIIRDNYVDMEMHIDINCAFKVNRVSRYRY